MSEFEEFETICDFCGATITDYEDVDGAVACLDCAIEQREKE